MMGFIAVAFIALVVCAVLSAIALGRDDKNKKYLVEPDIDDLDIVYKCDDNIQSGKLNSSGVNNCQSSLRNSSRNQ